MISKGTIKISNDIITNIAGLSALEIEGVRKVVGFNPETLMDSKIAPENKGIKMEIIDGYVNIDMSLIVENGAKIPEVASLVQNSIIDQITIMTGLNVGNVNLNICGIE